jgi:hypothetical protein
MACNKSFSFTANTQVLSMVWLTLFAFDFVWKLVIANGEIRLVLEDRKTGDSLLIK